MLLELLNYLKVDYIMGYSLGEYLSLVVSGVLFFEDVVRIVCKCG